MYRMHALAGVKIEKLTLCGLISALLQSAGGIEAA